MKRSILEIVYTWFSNTKSRIILTKYENQFIDTSMFVAQKMTKEDKQVLLGLFSLEELREALTEKKLMKIVEFALESKEIK